MQFQVSVETFACRSVLSVHWSRSSFFLCFSELSKVSHSNTNVILTLHILVRKVKVLFELSLLLILMVVITKNKLLVIIYIKWFALTKQIRLGQSLSSNNIENEQKITMQNVIVNFVSYFITCANWQCLRISYNIPSDLYKTFEKSTFTQSYYVFFKKSVICVACSLF